MRCGVYKGAHYFAVSELHIINLFYLLSKVPQAAQLALHKIPTNNQARKTLRHGQRSRTSRGRLLPMELRPFDRGGSNPHHTLLCHDRPDLLAHV